MTRLAEPSRGELDLFVTRAEAEMRLRQRGGEWSAGLEAHEEYQSRPLEWIVEKLGVPEHTIRWSLNPEYDNCTCNTAICQGNGPHVWDGDVDPLVTALETLAKGKSLAVRAGTTTSKTYVLAACGTLWWLGCFKNSIVLSLAPKQEQLLLNMWKEIGKKWPIFKQHFPTAELMTGKLRMREGEGEKEIWAATAFGAGLGADEEFAQRLKGFHERRMLWIIEEMAGVEQPKIDTIIKTATADFNPIMALGQPEHQHDTLISFGKRKWVTPIRISALDFPNVVCDREVIPGGRSKWSVERDLDDADGDEQDSGYLSQVRGVAPTESKRALIRWSWCDAAAARSDSQELRDGPLAMGVDVADSPTGDKSAISRWQGAVCTEVESFSADDASEVGRMVYGEITDPENPIDRRRVGIDSVGVGASAVNELKRLGVRVRLISGGTKALPRLDVEARWSEDGEPRAGAPVVPEAERYANLRCQVFWRLREDLRLGRIGLPNDKALFNELTAIEFEEPSGRITVEPKDKIKARLRHSPDKADAVAYGNWVRARERAPRKRQEEEKKLDPRNVDLGLEKRLARHQKRITREERMMKRLLKKKRSVSER